MRTRFIHHIFYFGCLLTSTCCIAQEEPIDTDRPDQTESVNTVPKKWLQFEAGFSIAQTDGNGNNEFQSPTLLSKYGVSKKFELRLITTLTTTLRKQIPNSVTTTGLEPIEIGGKIRLCEGKKWVPQTSLLFHAAIPGTASEAYDITHVEPNFRFTFQNKISDKLALGYNLGAEWDGEKSNPDYIYTFATGLNFTQRFYGYLEAFGTLIKDEPNEHSIDCGFAYNISNDCKIDISSGFGISPAAPDWYIALGISARIKTGK